MDKKEEKTLGDDVLAKEPEVKAPKIVPLTKEQLESRQRAHEMKVAKFLAGGEF